MANYQKSKFKDTQFGGSDGIVTPKGATGDRPGAPELGTMRYNQDLGFMEQYNATGWAGIDAPPTVTGITGTVNEDTDSTITVQGTNFKAGSTVAITGPGVNNVERAVSTTFVGSNELSVQTNAASVNFVAGASFGIKVSNPSGLSALLEPAGNIDSDPLWSTGAGNIATVNDEHDTPSPVATLSATDPDGTSVTYTETTSTLSAAGMTLNSNGTITGNPNNVTGATTVTFDATANSNGQSVPRTFNIIINPYPDGDSAARAFSTMDEIANIGYTGVQTLWTTLGGRVSAFQVNIDFATPNGPWLQNRMIAPSGYRVSNVNNSMIGVSNSTGNESGHNKDQSRSGVNSLRNYDISSIPDNNGTSNRIQNIMGFGSNSSGFATGTSGGNSGSVGGIQYYNFGTGSAFTAAQQFALYAQINQLSPHTPIVAWNSDSDNQQFGDTGVPWDNSSVPSNGTYSHMMVIGAEYTTNTGNFGNTDADWHKLTIYSSGEQTGCLDIWTHNTWNTTTNESGRTVGRNPLSGYTNIAGLEYTQLGTKGSYGGNNELRGSGIYPKAFRGYTGSGGGCAWGYYPSNLAAGAGGGNYPNVFLTKDYTV